MLDEDDSNYSEDEEVIPPRPPNQAKPSAAIAIDDEEADYENDKFMDMESGSREMS